MNPHEKIKLATQLAAAAGYSVAGHFSFRGWAMQRPSAPEPLPVYPEFDVENAWPPLGDAP